MAEVKNLKARAKKTPSRIESNIVSSHAIVDQKIVDNAITHVAEADDLVVANLPAGDVSVPLNLWLEYRDQLRSRGGVTAVQIASDEDPADLRNDLSNIDIIVLPFVAQVDGRGYSHAHLLRERFGYTGEIRAIGDVKFDQLGFLTRAGCNAFELPDTENYQTALRAFSEFSEFYQPAADQARLIFSRRRTVH